MRALLKVLLLIVVSAIAARVSAMAVSKQFDEGSEVSDEFRRMTILNALEFTSEARGLRNAEVSVCLGGAKVDLRNAVIDPAGARIVAENTLGGLAILVRSDWAVTVDELLVGGGNNDITVADPKDLPEDAPKLEIQVLTRLGGTVITSESVDF